MPTVYAIINKRSDERIARAEARRERIAEGISARQEKKKGLQSAKVAAGTVVFGGNGPSGGEDA
jgi:HAE1 family hydrophobic/amphiphilic exporter-1